MGSYSAITNKHAEYDTTLSAPERELLLAVLDRCVLDYHGTNRKLKLAATEWLFEEADDDIHKEFSFPWICEFLGFDKSQLRECIQRLDLSGKAPQGHRWLRKKVKSFEPQTVSAH